MTKRILCLYRRLHERMLEKFPTRVVDFNVLKMWLGGHPLYINKRLAKLLMEEMEELGLLQKKSRSAYVYLKKI